MASSLHKTLTCVAALGLSVSPTITLAQAQWKSCPIPPYPDDDIQRPDDLPAQAVHIEADSALFREHGISEMFGDVKISQQNKKMRADKATYEHSSSEVTGSGNVTFITPTLKAMGTEFRYNLNQDEGELQQVDYRLAITEGRGFSKRVVRESPQLTRLEQASYTTCPPNNPVWSLNSPNIRLYHEKEQGTATNVTLKIRQLPILYLPYFSFPLTDKRKSGFLFPTLKSSEKTGLKIGVPYYFNLAPNYDMTLTPALLSKRGLELGTEFRYLTQNHRGEVRSVLLPNDKISAVSNRYYYDLKHHTQLNERSSMVLDTAGVSDSRYFADLGNSLQATSEVNLERRLTYTTSGNQWTFSAMMQGYQVLDGGTKPHSRLPQLSLNYHPLTSKNGVTMQVDTEYTKFAGSKTAVNGSRLDLKATVSKNFANDAAYLKPSVSLRHSQYALNDARKTRVRRTLPTATVDAGLFFERNVKKGQYVQTLEPRLYYTQTPYKDQSAIPVFDSSENTFSYEQLFSENRFTGKDRIEDANRLSASVTTRFQDQKTGREVLRASVGQIYHFDERKVTLPGQPAQQGKRSEIVLETSGQINPRTHLNSTTFWDSDTKKLTANQVNLRYQDDKKRLVNVGYTRRKDEFKAGHLSFVTPVKENWKAIGGVEYDLLNKRQLETVIGAEYQSCCWKTRVASRNYLLPDNKTRDNAIFIEFELKGLGSFGSGARNLLQDRVQGYE